MNKLLRLLWLMWRARRAPRLAPTDVSRVPFRVLPNDLDLQKHMNNGVYLSIMDLGRMDLMVRSGVWRELSARGYYPVVVSSTITYRRSLGPMAVVRAGRAASSASTTSPATWSSASCATARSARAASSRRAS